MKKLLISTALVAMIGATASLAEAPKGANATDCDPTAFVAVRSEKTGAILYWNNPTCKAPEDTVSKARTWATSEEPEETE